MAVRFRALGLAAFIYVSVASAATLPFSTTTDELFLTTGGSPASIPINIQGFDPALGTLRSISLTIEVDAISTNINWTFQNTTNHTLASTSTTSTQKVQLFSGTKSLGSLTGTSTWFQSNTPSNGQFTLSGVWGASGSGTSNVSTANRPLFIGAGLIPFTLISTGVTDTETAGLALVSSSGLSGYSVTVSGVYTYTPTVTPPPVPEASTQSLCGIGALLVAIGVRRRRQNCA
jgi:hypothetical protein